MGCHTWFYKRVHRSFEEAKDIWIADQLKWVKRWEEMAANPDHHSRVSLKWTQEECENQVNVCKRKLRMVQGGYCQQAIWNHQPDDEQGERYLYVDEKLYYDSYDMPHDLFRIGGYPEDILFSLQETLDYLENNNDKIYYTHTVFDITDTNKLKEKTIERLTKFWTQYPEAMIKFG